mmetsp:Transcript_32717/g.98798  ORF Transcript_32717/g.98798 Transcript_32717/m.98798 type:complete len:391 (-) Transcript_32717:2264-3436(-)
MLPRMPSRQPGPGWRPTLPLRVPPPPPPMPRRRSTPRRWQKSSPSWRGSARRPLPHAGSPISWRRPSSSGASSRTSSPAPMLTAQRRPPKSTSCAPRRPLSAPPSPRPRGRPPWPLPSAMGWPPRPRPPARPAQRPSGRPTPRQPSTSRRKPPRSDSAASSRTPTCSWTPGRAWLRSRPTPSPRSRPPSPSSAATSKCTAAPRPPPPTLAQRLPRARAAPKWSGSGWSWPRPRRCSTSISAAQARCRRARSTLRPWPRPAPVRPARPTRDRSMRRLWRMGVCRGAIVHRPGSSGGSGGSLGGLTRWWSLGCDPSGGDGCTPCLASCALGQPRPSCRAQRRPTVAPRDADCTESWTASRRGHCGIKLLQSSCHCACQPACTRGPPSFIVDV